MLKSISLLFLVWLLPVVGFAQDSLKEQLHFGAESKQKGKSPITFSIGSIDNKVYLIRIDNYTKYPAKYRGYSLEVHDLNNYSLESRTKLDLQFENEKLALASCFIVDNKIVCVSYYRELSNVVYVLHELVNGKVYNPSVIGEVRDDQGIFGLIELNVIDRSSTLSVVLSKITNSILVLTESDASRKAHNPGLCAHLFDVNLKPIASDTLRIDGYAIKKIEILKDNSLMMLCLKTTIEQTYEKFRDTKSGNCSILKYDWENIDETKIYARNDLFAVNWNYSDNESFNLYGLYHDHTNINGAFNITLDQNLNVLSIKEDLFKEPFVNSDVLNLNTAIVHSNFGLMNFKSDFIIHDLIRKENGEQIFIVEKTTQIPISRAGRSPVIIKTVFLDNKVILFSEIIIFNCSENGDFLDKNVIKRTFTSGIRRDQALFPVVKGNDLHLVYNNGIYDGNLYIPKSMSIDKSTIQDTSGVKTEKLGSYGKKDQILLISKSGFLLENGTLFCISNKLRRNYITKKLKLNSIYPAWIKL